MKTLEEIRTALTCPVASVPTPFHQDGSIDHASLRNFIDFVIAGGTKTILLTYGDSLYSVLTDDEVADVTTVVAEHTAGRALVVAADRQWATPKEVAFAQFARSAGADVLMVLPPDWAASCTVETLVDHYGAVAAHIPVMVVTNYFAYRSNEFGLNVLRALAKQVPGVMAIKDDVCGEFARRMGLAVHDRFAIISGGQKQNHMNALFYGCDGYLSTFIKFKPAITNEYWNAIQSGNEDEARRIIREYDIPFFDCIASFPGGFNAALHGTLELFGVIKRWRRRPYYSLNDGELERLAGFCKDKKLL